jgi:hypothetical protein
MHEEHQQREYLVFVTFLKMIWSRVLLRALSEVGELGEYQITLKPSSRLRISG